MPRPTLRCVLRSMRRTAICSLPRVGSELRIAHCRCGGLLGAVATEAHGIELLLLEGLGICKRAIRK
jgi:hypothetical protein